MSFPLYCITNRHLYALPFLEQLDRILALRPAGVILREKDLSLEEYLALGRQVLELETRRISRLYRNMREVCPDEL